MNIKSRIERLEKGKIEAVTAEMRICSHPSIRLMVAYMPENKSYKPAFQYTQQFSCGDCFFQDYIFTHYGLDERETEFLYALKDTIKGYELRTDIIALLSELGIIAFAKFPATDEQKRDCLLPPLVKARANSAQIESLYEIGGIELQNAIEAEKKRLDCGCRSLENKIENELKRQGKNATLAELLKEWEKEWEKEANSKTVGRRFA